MTTPITSARAASTRAAATAALLLAALAGCQAPSINLGTNEPIKVDIAMRLDVYQHAASATPRPSPNPSSSPRPTAANPSAPTPTGTPPPAPTAAAARSKDRQADIQVFKNSRLVGENRSGLLTIIESPAGDYGDYVRRTVAQENRDRMTRMTALADEQKRPLPEIQAEQAALWTNRSFKGEWIEVPQPDGTHRWEQKPG